MNDSTTLHFAAAVNDEAVYAQNLGNSPIVAASEGKVRVIKGARSAGAAYNQALQSFPESNGIAVLVHQDVYFPRGWEAKLADALAWLETHAPGWGVLGLVGVDADGVVHGRSWSTGMQCEVGRTVLAPAPVVSVDEMVILVNLATGLQFDEQLPGYHLYGTDIVAESLARGHGTFVIDAPVIHNSLPVRALGRDYEESYCYMKRKWRRQLPMRTLILSITHTRWPVYRQRLRAWKRMLRGRPFATDRHPDPEALARELGYDGRHEGVGA